jgi:hypothetical protein
MFSPSVSFGKSLDLERPAKACDTLFGIVLATSLKEAIYGDRCS